MSSLTTVIEINDGSGWTPVCRYEDLVPGRGAAALLSGGEQAAVFRTRDGEVYAVANRDPFSGAYVMSRGLTGSRGEVPTVASPMYKQAFDLRTGACLDEEASPDGGSAELRVWPVRITESLAEDADDELESLSESELAEASA